MNISNEKVHKLIDIAKLYYEQDKTQSEIAKIYNISRPLVSRMLNEAKEFGIVNIEIRSPLEGNNLVLNQVRNIFNIKGGVVVPDSSNDNLTNTSIANAAIEYMSGLKADNFGLGWGTIIGMLVSLMESREPLAGYAKNVCPLVGNSAVPNRNYHSNEIVRLFAQQTFANPVYLHAPAWVETEQEINLFKELENYKAVLSEWDNLDVALVNIGNYPSVPDFASGARFGDVLAKKKAVGRLLSYYFNIEGEILKSDTDYAIQIPIETIAKCKSVIGICSSNVKPKALIGALHTGIFNHLIAPEELVKAAIENK